MGQVITAQTLSGVGGWVVLIGAQGAAAYQLGGGAVFLAVIAIAWGAPPVLLGRYAGRVIDRTGPRRVAVTASLLAVLAAAPVALTPAIESPPALTGLLFLQGCARAFALPAADSLPSWLEERPSLHSSSAWLGFAGNVPLIAGPLLAAWSIAELGPRWTFAFVCGIFGAAALLFGMVREVPGKGGHAADAEGTAPWSAVADPAVRAILLAAAFAWVSFGAFAVLEILYVSDVLRRGITTFALLQAAFGCGLLAVSAVLLRVPVLLRHPAVLWGSFALIGVSEVLYVVTRSVEYAFLGVTLWGISVAFFGPASRYQLLHNVPQERHGSVMGLWRAVQAGGSLAPALGIGLLAAWAGVQAVLVTVGALTALSCALLLMAHARARGPRDAPQAEAR